MKKVIWWFYAIIWAVLATYIINALLFIPLAKSNERYAAQAKQCEGYGGHFTNIKGKGRRCVKDIK